MRSTPNIMDNQRHLRTHLRVVTAKKLPLVENNRVTLQSKGREKGKKIFHSGKCMTSGIGSA